MNRKNTCRQEIDLISNPILRLITLIKGFTGRLDRFSLEEIPWSQEFVAEI